MKHFMSCIRKTKKLTLRRMNFTSINWERKIMAHAVFPQAIQRLSIAACAVISFSTSANGKPVAQWQFDEAYFKDGSLRPAIGPWKGNAPSGAQTTKQSPFALETDKDFRGIYLHEDISKAGLPKKALSVTAWLRVDKPLEWGGILGAIQDNGSFERGWILGYGKESFYFGVASESSQRLTYLNSSVTYAPANWYHLAGTYDGKTQRIYLDGKLAGESKAQKGSILYPPSGRFVLGAYLDDNEHYPMEGRIERITMWDRALDAKEIARQFSERKALFPLIDPVVDLSATADWPTFLHDNQRSGKGVASVKGKLALRWTHRLRLPPKPAWPPPAKQDFWHKKYNLKPRVILDRAFHIVGAGDRIYLASSADDQTRCLSLTNGTQ